MNLFIKVGIFSIVSRVAWKSSPMGRVQKKWGKKLSKDEKEKLGVGLHSITLSQKFHASDGIGGSCVVKCGTLIIPGTLI